MPEPFGSLPAGTRVLVVGAHPDDEILGCAGTLARHAEAGHLVQAVVVGEGATARSPRSGAPAKAPSQEVLALQESARDAARIIGAEPPIFLGRPDERLDTIGLLDLVKELEEILAGTRPRVVYTHHGGDLNMDHRLIHQAVLTACRPVPGHSVRSIYTFETLSSTEWTSPAVGEAFEPVRFVDITSSLERKIAALESYRSEMRPFPHPRSYEGIRALARLRGVTVGFEAAEAFMVIREVEG